MILNVKKAIALGEYRKKEKNHMKTCIECLQEKEDTDFSKGRNQCKKCRSEIVRGIRPSSGRRVAEVKSELGARVCSVCGELKEEYRNGNTCIDCNRTWHREYKRKKRQDPAYRQQYNETERKYYEAHREELNRKARERAAKAEVKARVRELKQQKKQELEQMKAKLRELELIVEQTKKPSLIDKIKSLFKIR